MSVCEKIHEVLKIRRDTDDELTDDLKICWEKETAVLIDNIRETIAFFDDECTYDEFY